MRDNEGNAIGGKDGGRKVDGGKTIVARKGRKEGLRGRTEVR